MSHDDNRMPFGSLPCAWCGWADFAHEFKRFANKITREKVREGYHVTLMECVGYAEVLPNATILCFKKKSDE